MNPELTPLTLEGLERDLLQIERDIVEPGMKALTVEDVKPAIDEAVAAAVAALPKPKNGKDGKRGPVGPMPDHRWFETELQFQTPDGGWGPRVDLRGPQGERGPAGHGGGGGGFSIDRLPLGDESEPEEILLKQHGAWVRLPWSGFIALVGNDIEPPVETVVMVDDEEVVVDGETVVVTL